ncbi:MAG: penicillin-binding protein 2 [Clostridiales bacterium]|nr:penicillin-binding protein 2 [Clostridiales bacterium]MDY3746634.1 penicillin-binding transpeptidase domain-containing protein [Lachnospiraceae bacterium]
MSKYSKGGYVPGEDDFEDTVFHMPLDESYDPENDQFDDNYRNPYGYHEYPSDTYGADEGNYDRGGYDGRDYDRGGYDERNYNRGGYDGRNYDRGSYDEDNYGRGSYGDNNDNRGGYGSGQSDHYAGKDLDLEEDLDSEQDLAPEDDAQIYSGSKRARKADKKKPKRVKNNQIMGILYGFLILFFAMIGYFVYFDVIDSKEALSNPNNIRVAKLADTVIRGKILASDGSVLAETLTDSSGNEYRSYPYHEMFSHVVGMSKTNKSGIEASGEYYLLTSSINPIQKAYNELKGNKSPGDNVITTLDTNLQKTAYEALGSQKGVVLAMDPSTGEILCMVSKPDYDPNTLAQNYDAVISDKNSKVLLNQATGGTFTPGSIFKMITALEYIREYPNYGNYSYTCYGSIALESGGRDAVLSCFDGHSHGTQNLTDSFANSCNSSFANIGLSLNIKKMNELCNTMLFNQKLPTDIPHSQSSFTLSDSATQWEIGATSIGQGQTTMTPLHALMITGAIANGGVVMKPYLMDSVESNTGTQLEKFMPESYGSIMSTSEAEMLKSMMQEVVSRGTAVSLSSLGMNIAGKTGTAEVDNAGNNAWFVGFAPADSPKIAVCVLVEDANTSSSYTAVPIAQQLFASYLGR